MYTSFACRNGKSAKKGITFRVSESKSPLSFFAFHLYKNCSKCTGVECSMHRIVFKLCVHDEEERKKYKIDIFTDSLLKFEEV